MPSACAERLGDLGLPLGGDLQPPGLGGEPGLDQGLALERVRDRVAPADVREVVARREVGAARAVCCP